jgi:hypothetical protein
MPPFMAASFRWSRIPRNVLLTHKNAGQTATLLQLLAILSSYSSFKEHFFISDVVPPSSRSRPQENC